MPAAVHDFYSPFMAAAIVQTDGTRYPLWSGVPALSEERVDLVTDAGQRIYSLPWLQDVSVELQHAHVPIMAATLTPPMNEGLAFLNSPLIEWGQSILEVQFGYSTGLEGAVLGPVYNGVILKPDVSIGADISITLRAQGVGGFDAIRATRGGEYNGTRAEIIEILARGPNPSQPRRLTVDFSAVEKERAAAVGTGLARIISRGVLGTATDALGAPPATSAYAALFQETTVRSQGYLTDWALIWKLVREARCTMVQVGDTLRILPINSSLAKTPQRTFALYHTADGRYGPDVGIFPILGVQSQNMAVYLPAGTRGLTLAGIDSATREILRAVVDDETARPTRTNEGAAGVPPTDVNPGIDPETGDGGQSVYGDPSDSEALREAQAEFDALINGMGIPLTIESLGDPQMVPGEVIAVRGLGRRIDHNYGVLKVTHKLGSSGYTMTLECVSNVIQLGEQFALAEFFPEGEINTQEPPEADVSGVEVEPELGE